MLTKFMKQEGPQVSLPVKFRTSFFSGDSIREKSSYNHLVFPIGSVFSSDYISLRISLIL
jgi:hypothetical protein